jgi:DNA-nicking Smr family endonuclease
MTSGDNDNGDLSEQGPARFADLIGDAKPLDKGPKRVQTPSTKLRPTDRMTDPSKPSVAKGFRWPDPENRFSACAEGVNDLQLFSLSQGEPEPEERIDLHGARRDQAGRLLSKRLESARSQGLACVLIIHGQGQHSATGEAVLREALPGWLTQGTATRHVLAFSPAPDRLGGNGATLVLLRRSGPLR